MTSRAPRSHDLLGSTTFGSRSMSATVTDQSEATMSHIKRDSTGLGRTAITMEIYTQVPSAATRAALKKLGEWLDT
jgi:hypothetical protein